MQPVPYKLDQTSVIPADVRSVASDSIPRPLGPDGTVVDDEDKLSSIFVLERAFSLGMLVIVALESVRSAS
jgi:hypothetical protein